MDLDTLNFKNSGSGIVELINPVTEEKLYGDDGEPMWIEASGADSPAFRKAVRAYGNKKLQKGRTKQTVEEIEQVACKILAEATVGWSSNVVVKGEVLEFNAKNAEWLYTEFSWIREQVDTFVNERANFLPAA